MSSKNKSDYQQAALETDRGHDDHDYYENKAAQG